MSRSSCRRFALGAFLVSCAVALAQTGTPQTAPAGPIPTTRPAPAGRTPANQAVPVPRTRDVAGARGVETQPAGTPVPTTGPGGKIEVEPKEFNFGEVWQGMLAKKEFTIKNTGEGALTIDARSSCGCTVPSKPKSPLPPGESTTFTITYDTSRLGEAHKVVTLATNDAAQPALQIPVNGNVKPLFETSPATLLNFEWLDVEDETSKALTLRNKYDKPLTLHLREGQEFGTFKIDLKEIKPGEEYELTATTKPPLKLGYNGTMVHLETGLPDLPPLTVQVTGNAQPRVFLSPFVLAVTPDDPQPNQQIVRVQYKKNHPVSVVGVKADLPGITSEVLPDVEMPAGAQSGFHQIRVSLPPTADFPEQGAKIIVTTSDPDPAYQTLELPIRKQPSRKKATTRPLAPQPTSAPAPANAPPPGAER
jgi:hypothetical protein